MVTKVAVILSKFVHKFTGSQGELLVEMMVTKVAVILSKFVHKRDTCMVQYTIGVHTIHMSVSKSGHKHRKSYRLSSQNLPFGNGSKF